MKRFFFFLFFCAGVLYGEEPFIRFTSPRNGATFPAGTRRVAVSGVIAPKEAPFTCDGRSVDVYRKTGAFLEMLPVRTGTNRWSFCVGNLKKEFRLMVRAPQPEKAVLRLTSFQQPVGAEVGEEILFSCTGPTGRVVCVTVGERPLKLSEDPRQAGTYRTRFRYHDAVTELPVLFWSAGLPELPAAPLTVRKAWPLVKVTAGRFEARAREDETGGETVGFLLPGMVLRQTGFRSGMVRCRVGGQTVWVARNHVEETQGGSPAESLPDLSKGFSSRPVAGKKPSDLLILLDPGHGGSDTGALGPSGRFEKEANLLQARAIQKALAKAGFRVRLTREKDVSLGLYQRVCQSVDLRADAFLSIHHNACAYTTDPREVRHFISFGWNERGLELARALHGPTVAVSGLRDRGVVRKSFAVCRNPAVPSCLMEFDFINCPEGEDAIFQRERCERFAQAIVQGFFTWMQSGKECGSCEKMR